MKKDEKLEKAFEEYFDGIEPPAPESALNAAKQIKYEKKKKTGKTLGWALSAAACAVLVFTASIFAVNAGVNGVKQLVQSSGYDYYGSEALTPVYADAYSDDLPASLSFMKKLDLASNASVNNLTIYEKDEKLALVKAEVSSLFDGTRQDAVIYAEFTAKKVVYEEVKSFTKGEKITYKNLDCKYTYTILDDGEYASKVCFTHDGVKYYLEVKGTDQSAYKSYIDVILT